MWAIEKSNAYKGNYHVLGGVLSAIDGIGPNDLNLNSLFRRIKDGTVEELILATNATMEGQITAQFIADSCKNEKVRVTRLAQGMPIGGELDTLDFNTMSTAFDSRSEMKTKPLDSSFSSLSFLLVIFFVVIKISFKSFWALEK